MATVTNTIKLPDGTAPSRASVEIRLLASESVAASEAGWVTATDVTVLSVSRPTVTAGVWSADLVPNANITPAGTVYRVDEFVGRDRYTHYIEVDSDGGSVFDLQSEAPAALASGPLAAHIADTTDAHDASAISFTPARRVTDTNTQDAIANAVADRRITGGSSASVQIASGHTGNEIASDVIAATVLGGGQTNRENVIGASTTANVNTDTSNLPTTTGTVANYSVILGGYDNVANGLMSMIGGAHNLTESAASHPTISGGSSNSITDGDYGTIGGGTSNTASGTQAAIAGGGSNTASGAYSFTAGQGNTVSGAGAVALGSACTASGASAVTIGQSNSAEGNYSSVFGREGRARTYGQAVFSADGTSAAGDAQCSIVMVRRTTTDATVSTLGVTGGNTVHTLLDESSVAFEATVVAREAATGDSVMWTVKGLVVKEAGSNSAFIGTPTVTKEYASAGASTWALTVTANSSAGSFQLRGQGEVSKTIQWVGRINMVEVVA